MHCLHSLVPKLEKVYSVKQSMLYFLFTISFEVLYYYIGSFFVYYK